MLILFSGETGTAEDVSYWVRTWIASNFKGTKVSVCNISSYDIATLAEEKRPTIFVVSTAGDGEVATSMKKFWSILLRRSLPANCLQSLLFTVFGLGDSSYEKYNAAARKLYTRLKQLGANELCSLGVGDDQAEQGYFEGLTVWLALLKGWCDANLRGNTSASKTGKVEDGKVSSSPTRSSSSPRYEVSRLPDTPLHDGIASSCSTSTCKGPIPSLLSNTIDNTPNGSSGSSSVAPAAATIWETEILENTRMTGPEWRQDVRYVRFGILGAAWKAPVAADGADGVYGVSGPPLYRAGDVAEVYYRNTPELVARAVAMLPFPDYCVIGSSNNLGAKGVYISITRHVDDIADIRETRLGDVPVCSVHDLYEAYLDIGAIPKRSFFGGLAEVATNEEEKEKLEELASGEGTDLYYDYCVREKRNYVEVLEEFTSARPSIAKLLEIVPRIQPRQYSIASSCLSPAKSSEIGLCVAVTTYSTPYGRKRTGLCSGFLGRCEPGGGCRVLVRIKQGILRDTPLLQTTSNIMAGSSSSNSSSSSSSISERGAGAGAGAGAGVGTTAPPCIMVGPGTGVAPMRAFIHDRINVQLINDSDSIAHVFAAVTDDTSGTGSTSSTSPSGTTGREEEQGGEGDCNTTLMLFFGCRKQEQDFLFHQEWDQLNNSDFTFLQQQHDIKPGSRSNSSSSSRFSSSGQKGNERVSIISAFSQDQTSKDYVTNRIRANGEAVWRMLQQDANVFVAGSAKRMPQDVRAALLHVIQEHGGLSTTDAEKFVALMVRRKKYIQEVW